MTDQLAPGDPMKPLIIHHANCPDGFGAAWWLARNLPAEWEPAELLPMGYDDTDITNVWYADRPVFVVDFCLPANRLDQIASEAKCMIVIDHHETAVGIAETVVNLEHFGSLDEWERDWALNSNFVIVIDQDRSGCGLVADWVARTTGARPPDFLYNLEDRDLWRFELGDTRDVFAAVTAHPYEQEVWDALAKRTHYELVAMGEAINLYRDRLIEQVAASSFELHLDGWVIPCASSPYAIGSDVAGRLAEHDERGIGAYVILHQADVQIGLRSRGDGPNVAELAQQYGGGGHPHASGLRLSWEEFGLARALNLPPQE